MSASLLPVLRLSGDVAHRYSAARIAAALSPSFPSLHSARALSSEVKGSEPESVRRCRLFQNELDAQASSSSSSSSFDARVASSKGAVVPLTARMSNNQNQLELSAELPSSAWDALPPFLRRSMLVCRVHRRKEKEGELWDLRRPLPLDATRITAYDFASDEGRQVLWHSSAHVLGNALEREFGDAVKLCDGPALDCRMCPVDEASEGDLERKQAEEGERPSAVMGGSGGFFYEMALTNGTTISSSSLAKFQKTARSIASKNHAFERVEISPDVARDMFRDNPFKMEMIDRLENAGETLTAYRSGEFVDLCRGPHVPSTAAVGKKALALLRCGASHDESGSGTLLQRVYGIAFPTKKELKWWKQREERAKGFDHRIIGKKMGLFKFHDEYSPGSAFMLPRGTVVVNRLMEMLRGEYAARGYDEVITPNMYTNDLWSVSGHLENYKDDMYFVSTNASLNGGDDDGAPSMGLKPMNCPGHCLIYAMEGSRSYRELPLKVADFGVLHRNEVSGALGGLTRVRRFQQDDAHIFCREDQIEAEIDDCLDFVSKVYQKMFGFTFDVALSTRPEKSIGDDASWDAAETALRNALLRRPDISWTVGEGEGAFYGPKLDFIIHDNLGRSHQLGTIQLDFQLPARFALDFVDDSGERRQPVMIHRAVLGSLERFLAMILEHTRGKLPFWLSPRQVAVVPVSSTSEAYATRVASSVKSSLAKAGSANALAVDVIGGNQTMRKRVREAQQAPYNLIVVVGEKDENAGTAVVRSNDGIRVSNLSLSPRELGDACAQAVHARERDAVPGALLQLRREKNG